MFKQNPILPKFNKNDNTQSKQSNQAKWIKSSKASKSRTSWDMPIRLEAKRVTEPNKEELEDTIKYLNDFISQDIEEDERPTQYAYGRAYGLINEIYQISRLRFFAASIAIGEDQSVSVYWKKGKQLLKLSIPANAGGKFYAYIREGSNSRIEENPSVEQVAKFL